MPRFVATILPTAIASLWFLPSELHAQKKPGEADAPPAISAISEHVRPYVEHQEISGAVTLVATPDRIVHLDAIGRADKRETGQCALTPSSGSPR